MQEDAIYQRWLNRAALASCGDPEDLVPADDYLATRASHCLRAAQRSGEGAEATLVYQTVEGDPIRNYLRVLPEGRVEVFHDGTEDGFGTGTWVYRKCDGLRQGLFLAC